MARHILRVEVDTDYAAKYPTAPVEYQYRLECPDGNGCRGWSECPEEHPFVCRHDYCDPDEPCDDIEPDDEQEFHGVAHTYISGYGWMVPYGGCLPRAQMYRDLSLSDVLDTVRVGVWEVTDEWEDDEWMDLRVVTEIAEVPW